jgi:imidazolonepropionase
MSATVFTNLHLATMADADGYGELRDGAVRVEQGSIAWVGARSEAPLAGAAQVDCGGNWLTPGLIDCHTHIVHAGNRSDEFEARLNGASYEDIARAGGGIMSTVRATRAASEDQLLRQSLPRIASLLAEGVTTIEIKSGYGLELASEARMLRVARRAGARLPVRVVTTFLGAHALAPEFAGAVPTTTSTPCVPGCPPCTRRAWSTRSTRSASASAFPAGRPNACSRRPAGTACRSSCTPNSCPTSAAQLVARFGGLLRSTTPSTSAAKRAAMAAAGTVAVLLPGAFYFLRDTIAPPVAALRAAGVPMALATDCNPGTSPLTSILLAMNMACILWRLTPQEALAGCTIHAARALGLQADAGSIEAGKRADFALWEIARPADLSCAIGFNPCRGVVNAGVLRAPVVSWRD